MRTGELEESKVSLDKTVAFCIEEASLIGTCCVVPLSFAGRRSSCCTGFSTVAGGTPKGWPFERIDGRLPSLGGGLPLLAFGLVAKPDDASSFFISAG